MEIKDYTKANKDAWNEAMPKHQQSSKEYLDEFFSVAGAVILNDPELLRIIKELNIEGKRVIHLCCNNGIELMSLKNMGAGRCVGVDISDLAIKEAHDRKAIANIDCEFICSDVFNLPNELSSQFDIVFITTGCIGWMPDIDQFFGICAQLLRREGCILMHEMHPFSEMLAFDSNEVDDRSKIIEPYFRSEPIIENEGIDYVGKTVYEAKTTYWFVHTISNIVKSLNKHGFIIKEFHESAKDISACHAKVEVLNAGIPLSMIILGKK